MHNNKEKMKKIFLMMLGLCLMTAAHAQDEETIDISGNNTSSTYKSQGGYGNAHHHWQRQLPERSAPHPGRQGACDERPQRSRDWRTSLHPSLTTQQPIYDLQGRRIESSLSESVSLRTKLKPGLYVSKGSKWVVR